MKPASTRPVRKARVSTLPAARKSMPKTGAPSITSSSSGLSTRSSSQLPKPDSIAPRRARTRCPLRPGSPCSSTDSTRSKVASGKRRAVPNSSVNQPWPFWARPSTDWGSRSARLCAGAAKGWPIR